MRAAQACTIDRTLRAIADICRRFGVRRLEVFGSAARATDFHPGSSDADFLVEFVPSNGLPFLRRFFDLEAACRNCWAAASIWWNLARCGTRMSGPASIGRARSFMERDARSYLRDIQESANAIARRRIGISW
jgi:predicted nucleotidyltransferase